MFLKIAADSLVLIHFGFILFVVFGGLLALRWRGFMWIHIPAAIWGAFIEVTGGVCPLTPLENRLRSAAGGVGYSGGFIEQYLIPVVYPPGLTRWIQVALGMAVVCVNLAVYGLLIARSSQRKNGEGLTAR